MDVCLCVCLFVFAVVFAIVVVFDVGVGVNSTISLYYRDLGLHEMAGTLLEDDEGGQEHLGNTVSW